MVLGGLGRRRAQTAVLVATVLTAVTASLLATGLLVGSSAPFDRAFSQQHGAHLTAEVDAAKATAAQLAATTRLAGVAATAGPFPMTTVHADLADAPGAAGPDLPPLAVVGRDDRAGPVDRVSLVDGSWVDRPGEIVLAASLDFRVPTGTRLVVRDLPGSPELTVVGIARSTSRTADAWVTSAQLSALTAAGGQAGYEMLYRLDEAGTAAAVHAGQDAVEDALPDGAVTATRSYLDLRRDANAVSAAYVPFVAAFGVLGLAMSTLIISIVVSGAVGAARWRIGVLKSLGFTPGQVVTAYAAQTLAPAAVGVGLGVLLGNLLAVPVLADQADAYGGPDPTIPLWVDAAVTAGALALVAGAAVASARRAGRMRTVEAISLGRAPRAGRGRLARRLAGRLPLPRPVSLGLANPFARPARAAVLAAAVGLGALGVTFAVGLGTTLTMIQKENGGESPAAVAVHLGHAGGEPGGGQREAAPGEAPGPGGGPAGPETVTVDPAAVAAAVAAQPGTASYYGLAQTRLGVRGMVGAADVSALTGDPAVAARRLITGRWLAAPGEAVADTRLLRAAGARVGDQITVTDAGRAATVLVVGEVFDGNDDANLLTMSSSLSGLRLDLAPEEFGVDLAPGTDLTSYLQAAEDALAPLGADAEANEGDESTVIVAMISLITTLTLMIVVVAVLGVLNTVVLDTRERVHDLGVFKALGMTPRQTIVMVVTSVAGIGAVAGLVGVPLGIGLHHAVVPLMGDAITTGMPAAYIDVYGSPALAALAVGGLVIAAAGAMLPATWAAGTRTATALRTE
ncbi:ABC transporter permease [Pseudofrankia asymbiotica]|uniref:ABC transporter permease n=1 Tax=Pseudofrankia asymbiotica TaxID=1834516 RepID=A0A1V2IDN1_9ACTN|nr:ABC transporter permease [Pseudofrankia asymbiotica]